MKLIDVNTLVTTIRSDASSQIAGFLYQFIVALDYCFQLSPGQSLYIEKYGDVAIKDDGRYDDERKDISVEVKMYDDKMSVNHHNFLNTLNNWMEDEFHFENYQTLIIYTTQQFSTNSPLIGWNSMSSKKRILLIKNTYSEYLKVNKSKIADKDPSNFKTVKRNASQMQRILESVRKEDGSVDEVLSNKRLESLLERVVIYDSCNKIEQAYTELLKYAKVTTDSLQETYINSLLGFIITPKNMRNGWKIEYSSFTQEVQRLAVVMSPQVIDFPDPPEMTINVDEYNDALFVLKLKDIDYNRITDAVVDYAKTTGLLLSEFNRSLAEKNLEDYQDELLQVYKLQYDNAMDKLFFNNNQTDESIKNASRIFLRDMLLSARNPEFKPFRKTKPFFSNGMCHFLANDCEINVKWLLENE